MTNKVFIPFDGISKCLCNISNDDISFPLQTVVECDLFTTRGNRRAENKPSTHYHTNAFVRDMTDTPVYFYRRNEAFGEFSNFYLATIELDGYTWPTTEHYFQAQKYVSNEEHFQNILRLPTPRDAFAYVRTHKSARRADWDQVKDEIMFKACLAKFQQHPKLKKLLLSTGDRTIVEHTTNDSYWADGGDGTGRNQLGITLMKVREELKKN